MKSLLLIICFSIFSFAFADSFEYSRIYSKLSTSVYELENDIQQITQKNIFITLEEFSVENAQQNQFVVQVEGAHSFSFEAQFLLTNITLANYQEQVDALEQLILTEIEQQVIIRQQDAEALNWASNSPGNNTMGIDVSLNHAAIWVQLRGIDGQWMRTSLQAGGTNFATSPELFVEVKSTIWTCQKNYESDTGPIENHITIVELGTIDGQVSFNPNEDNTHGAINVTVANAELEHSINLTSALKIYYQLAASLGVQFFINSNEFKQYIDFHPKARVGIIFDNKLITSLGLDLDLSFWDELETAFAIDLQLDYLFAQNTALSFGLGYRFASDNYSGSDAGFFVRLGIKVKLK